MKILFSVVAFMLALNAGIAQGQNGPRNMGARNYDPTTVTTVQGKIKAIEKQTSGYNGGVGIHLLVQTATGEIPVHVGPQWYVEKQGMTFGEGDQIKVEGSKVTMNGQMILIARKIEKGNKSMELRTKGGTPLWAGRNNR